MSARDWLQIITAVLTGSATVAAFLLRRSYQQGREDMQLQADLVSITKRLDQAGKLMSDLATEVQGLPERLRQEFGRQFMARDVCEERWVNYHVQHTKIETELQELWKACERRRGPR